MAAAPSETTSVGTLLNGTYLLERVIAEGGMGVVYEAQHLRLPRKVAVKVLGKPKDASLAATALPPVPAIPISPRIDAPSGSRPATPQHN